MKVLLSAIYEFCNLTYVKAISIVLFVCIGVHSILIIFKVLKSSDGSLYNKKNLQCIAFGLSSAIDGYRDNFSDEELLCNEYYVKLCVLHHYVCKLLGETTTGEKLNKE